MPNWFRSNAPDDNQGEFKPDEFKNAITTEFQTGLTKLQAEQDAKLAPLLQMAENFRLAQENAERQRTIDANKKKASEEEVDEDLWITNPAEAQRRSTKPLEERTQALAALYMRKETLGEKEYYTGELKTKIDQLIDSQPLSMRSNPQVLENAYFTVIGRNSEEIQAGKYKKQLSMASFNGNGTGGNKGNGAEENDDILTDEERFVANKFGMSEVDWKKNKIDAREKGSLTYV